MRWATPAEISRWDDLVIANPDGGNSLQSRAWGETKARWGWHPAYVLHDDPQLGQVAILFLRRRFPGLGELWYAPKGPGVKNVTSIQRIFADRSLFNDAFAVKVEPEIVVAAVSDHDRHSDGSGSGRGRGRGRGGDDGDSGRDSDAWHAAGFRKTSHDIQISRATIIVDLRRSEAELLASFKPKCRYNIRLAAKRGVVVRAVPTDDRYLEAMFQLLDAALRRAAFPVRRRQYYFDYWRLQAASGQGQLFLAWIGDEVIAGAFVSMLGRKSWYKDGGSTGHHAALMAPHLVQWEAMRWLRQRGAESYDLVAVPPQAVLNEAHPLFGLYRFKSGFADVITEYPGTYDLPLGLLRYRLWATAGERIASRWSLLQQSLLY